MPQDHNEQYKILELSHKDESKQKVYLLNPGDYFERFGGSRHNLDVRKTASLIIRTEGPMGLNDVEFDITRKDVWESIFNAVRNEEKK